MSDSTCATPILFAAGENALPHDGAAGLESSRKSGVKIVNSASGGAIAGAPPADWFTRSVISCFSARSYAAFTSRVGSTLTFSAELAGSTATSPHRIKAATKRNERLSIAIRPEGWSMVTRPPGSPSFFLGCGIREAGGVGDDSTQDGHL